MKTAHQLLATLIAVAAVAATAPAAANIVVDFTFDGSPTYPGHVTGELDFASTGVGVAATAAYVFTANNVELPDEPTLNLVGGAVTDNSFTVTAGGVVIAADLDVTTAQALGPRRFVLDAAGSQNSFGTSGQAINNMLGFAGVTYAPRAPAVASAPEPAVWAMMILGMGAIGLAMRRGEKPAARGSYAA